MDSAVLERLCTLQVRIISFSLLSSAVIVTFHSEQAENKLLGSLLEDLRSSHGLLERQVRRLLLVRITASTSPTAGAGSARQDPSS